MYKTAVYVTFDEIEQHIKSKLEPKFEKSVVDFERIYVDYNKKEVTCICAVTPLKDFVCQS